MGRNMHDLWLGLRGMLARSRDTHITGRKEKQGVSEQAHLLVLQSHQAIGIMLPPFTRSKEGLDEETG